MNSIGRLNRDRSNAESLTTGASSRAAVAVDAG
jgi:hypothetical protein